MKTCKQIRYRSGTYSQCPSEARILGYCLIHYHQNYKENFKNNKPVLTKQEFKKRISLIK